jgi:hypothetical protein
MHGKRVCRSYHKYIHSIGFVQQTPNQPGIGAVITQPKAVRHSLPNRPCTIAFPISKLRLRHSIQLFSKIFCFYITKSRLVSEIEG